jgi:conjugal transfer pilus assembly protein TraE
MNYRTFLLSWRGTQVENRIARWVIVLLACAVLYQALQVSRIERTVVLVPPEVNEAIEISRTRASREAQESWALYLAQLLGNVTAETAPFLRDILEPLLAGNLRQDVLDLLTDQVEDIRRERLDMRFEPREIAYEASSQHTYVTGKHTTRGPGVVRPHEQIRTYEVRVDYRNYRPLITFLDVYPGEPKLPSAREKEAQAHAAKTQQTR